MPAKSLIVAHKADKQFLKLPRATQARIIQAYDKIKNNPLIGPKLGGELDYSRKFRVGDYRIVYKFDSKESIIEVVKIEHRQGVYK